jgi:hypothetical protein
VSGPAPATGDTGARLAVSFGRILRQGGVAVPGGAVAGFAAALDALGLERRADVYWAGRATLLTAPEDAPTYDAAFAAFFVGGSGALPALPPEPVPVTLVVEEEDEDGAPPGDEGGEPSGPRLALRFSRAEVLRHQDLATCTPDELEEAFRLMVGVRLGGAVRRSRRLRPARPGAAAPTSAHGACVAPGRRRARPPLPATARDETATGGPAGRRQRLHGALRPGAPALRAERRRRSRRVEAFTLGTRPDPGDPRAVVTRPRCGPAGATGAGRRLGGGTRLGDGLAEFAGTWGVRGMARGAWSWSSPTAGSGATPTPSATRWHGCSGWRTRWCGSTPQGLARVRPAGGRDGCGAPAR